MESAHAADPLSYEQPEEMTNRTAIFATAVGHNMELPDQVFEQVMVISDDELMEDQAVQVWGETTLVDDESTMMTTTLTTFSPSWSAAAAAHTRY